MCVQGKTFIKYHRSPNKDVYYSVIVDLNLKYTKRVSMTAASYIIHYWAVYVIQRHTCSELDRDVHFNRFVVLNHNVPILSLKICPSRSFYVIIMPLFALWTLYALLSSLCAIPIRLCTTFNQYRAILNPKSPFRPFQNKNLLLITLFQKFQWGMRFFLFRLLFEKYRKS